MSIRPRRLLFGNESDDREDSFARTPIASISSPEIHTPLVGRSNDSAQAEFSIDSNRSSSLSPAEVPNLANQELIWKEGLESFQQEQEKLLAQSLKKALEYLEDTDWRYNETNFPNF
ncbi:hypothetical protein K7432_007872 [Basidiobolus ranarum]|uniref:Uncharacterized protein n=1 Tax=Basidiobolus ranarum TaxID=34480 RepID=A0ABR2WSQ8_9FUNG